MSCRPRDCRAGQNLAESGAEQYSLPPVVFHSGAWGVQAVPLPTSPPGHLARIDEPNTERSWAHRRATWRPPSHSFPERPATIRADDGYSAPQAYDGMTVEASAMVRVFIPPSHHKRALCAITYCVLYKSGGARDLGRRGGAQGSSIRQHD